MVREIVHDPIFLSYKSTAATEADIPIAEDLIDTLRANLDRCVGMAANMIGKRKRIIAIAKGPMIIAMLNPRIISGIEEYEAEEGCLSLPGRRKTKRFRSIKVRYRNEQFQVRLKTFSGWTAQIIQHEIDHCSGILI